MTAWEVFTLPVRSVVAATLAWSALMLLVAATNSPQHDYVGYLGQWRAVLAGADPWMDSSNAYGPLHVLFAWLMPAGPVVPRLFGAALLIAANAFLVAALLERRPDASGLLAYTFAIPANMLVIGIGFFYGLNDTVVAGLVGFATIARISKRPLLCGVLLGVAALEKFYPLLLVLPFAVDERRFDWRIVAGAIGTFAIGMLLSWALWGAAVLQPLTFGVMRGANLMSPVNALSSVLGDGVGLLSRVNAIAVLAAFGLAFAVGWWRWWSWLENAVVSFLAALVAYKVGHPQFYLSWLVMIGALPTLGRRSADRLAVACVPLALFLSLFQLGYEFGSDGYREQLSWVRAYGGFLLLGFAALVPILWKFGKQTGESALRAAAT